jgi:hypothetical protein
MNLITSQVFFGLFLINFTFNFETDINWLIIEVQFRWLSLVWGWGWASLKLFGIIYQFIHLITTRINHYFQNILSIFK